MRKTLFEQIADREIPADIVYEDELCVAFYDIQPQAPIHVLIVPRKPITRIGAAESEDGEILSTLLLAAGKVAKQLEVLDPERGFRLVINHGRDGGESVPHLHVHLLAGRELQWPPG